MIKRITAIILAMLVVVSAAFASDTNHFSSKELSLGLGTDYTLDKGNLFANNYEFNLKADVSYFLTRHLGAEVILPFYRSSGVFIREVTFGPVVRVPLYDRIAPYVGIGATYNWIDDNFTYVARTGVDVRLFKGWGVFVGGDYTVRDLHSLKQGAWQLDGGIRLVF